jgi:amidase
MSPTRPSAEDVAVIAQRLGYHRVVHRAAEFAELIAGTLDAYDAVDQAHDAHGEAPDRGPVSHRRPQPDEDPDNAWVLRTELSTTVSGPLAGRRVAVKDNIMVAGLPMSAGSGLLTDYQPAFDATVTARVLGAGATVVGKTNCEYFCLDGGSHTSHFGLTHNPHRRGYSAGGSSSGNAVALATGQADLAIGTDQAGSARVPASFCGVVGLKPTYGLVPYTGITPLDPVIDHAGVMATTVRDAALLLSALAGYDDYDPRQRRVTVGDYLSGLHDGVSGLRIGVLVEGFGGPGSEPDVDAAIRRGSADLAALGAEVVEVSVPMHARGAALWTPIVMHGMARTVVHGQGFGAGRDDRFPTDLIEHLLARRNQVNEMPATVTACAILAEYVEQTHGIAYYARAVNAVRRLRADYDQALHQVDLLLMPTTPHTAHPIPSADAPVASYVGEANDMFANTAPFNATHHPALSLPCGQSDGLPIGLMLVGRHFDDATVLRAGHAYEHHTR